MLSSRLRCLQRCCRDERETAGQGETWLLETAASREFHSRASSTPLFPHPHLVSPLRTSQIAVVSSTGRLIPRLGLPASVPWTDPGNPFPVPLGGGSGEGLLYFIA